MRYLIEPIAGSQRALVFGLVWVSVIGHNPEKEARQYARRTKAQFYTRGRTRSTVVGVLALQRGKDKPHKQGILYSAAAAFAHAHDRGAVAIHLPLRNGGFWVSAAVDGMVQVGSDVIHDTAEAAQEHLGQLRQMHAALLVLEAGDLKLQEGVFLDNLTEAARLQRTSATLSDQPVRLWAICAILLTILTWQIVRQRHAANQEALLQASRQLAPVDAVAAWQAVLRTWSQQQMMHGMSAVYAMLDNVARMPVAPGRWELDTIDCQPTVCQALYRRTRLADNLSLKNALPPAWEVQWIDIDSASVVVPTQWQGQPGGDIVAMPSAQTYIEDILTRWQRLRPAIEDIRIGPKIEVQLVAPLVPNADGNPSPLPFPAQSGLIRPFLREVTIHAPLRTLALLAWPEQSQISLLQIRRNHASAVDLTHSSFHAMLKGVIYVQ